MQEMSSISFTTSSNLFLKEELADIYFVVISDGGRKQRIPAHKMVLSNASKVFKAMFYGTIKIENSEFILTDISAASCTEFLRCIYKNQLELTTETISDVIKLAKEYEVAKCFNICKRFLDQDLPEDKAFIGYQLALLYELSELEVKFGQIITKQPRALLESNEFVDCSRDFLKNLLSESLLCDPMEVFSACMRWAKNACEKKSLDPAIIGNLRQELGDIFYLIPFWQMSQQQFPKCLRKYKGLFKADELEDLILITSDKTSAMMKSMFRRNVAMEGDDIKKFVWLCSYNDVSETQKYWLKETETFKISSQTRQILCALKLLEVRFDVTVEGEPTSGIDDTYLAGAMSVVEKPETETENDRRILLEQHIIIKCSAFGDVSNQMIKFIEPIVIERGKNYEIQFDFDSSWSELTFYAVIPNSMELSETGMIKSELYYFPNGVRTN